MLPERGQRHPNPFPIKLPTPCIFSMLDDKTGVVLDPYAGIGTTLVAKLLNCQSFWIDISKAYIAIAQERLANAEQERLRVLAEFALHKVRKTFKERKEQGKWVGRFRPSLVDEQSSTVKQISLPMMSDEEAK